MHKKEISLYYSKILCQWSLTSKRNCCVHNCSMIKCVLFLKNTFVQTLSTLVMNSGAKWTKTVWKQDLPPQHQHPTSQPDSQHLLFSVQRFLNICRLEKHFAAFLISRQQRSTSLSPDNLEIQIKLPICQFMLCQIGIAREQWEHVVRHALFCNKLGAHMKRTYSNNSQQLTA